jgi:hypothetical protein
MPQMCDSNGIYYEHKEGCQKVLVDGQAKPNNGMASTID